MKRSISLITVLILMTFVVLIVQPALGLIPVAQDQEPLGEGKPESGGMPSYPLPEKPIPHHEPGGPSRAGSYRTEVTQLNELGMMETVQLTGLDAMAADGIDPLAENYTLVNWDTILASSSMGDQFNLQTYKYYPDPDTIKTITGSETFVGAYPNNDIAAVDLNNDGQTEQIAAWIGENDEIFMRIGEMPGSLGRTTSKPASVVNEDGSMDLLVRGYDEALWHRHFDGSSWGDWNNSAGGLLLSAPAVSSRGDGSFDVYAIGSDNQIHRRRYDGLVWLNNWSIVGESNEWTPLGFWTGPTPELDAPAVVARGDQVDLFRLGPDNTLRWLHSNDGETWGGTWTNLGGMLGSAPGVISLNSNQMQVFARGVDEALWHLTYNGGWGQWQRAELNGMGEDVTIASAPTVATSGDLIDVYVLGSDQNIWQAGCNGSNCVGWNLLGAPEEGTLASNVAVASGDWKYIARMTDGSMNYSGDGNTWSDFGDGLPPWYLVYPTGLTGQKKMMGGWQDFSLKVEPGYFWGDGRSQIALAYFSEPNKLSVAIYETAEKFLPSEVTQFVLPQGIDYFSIATGDFLDGDGTDEIALAYTQGNTYNLDVIKVTREGLSVEVTGEVETVTIPDEDGDDYENGWFTGTFDITSGDFDGDGQDEIGLITVWNEEDWIENLGCDSYLYSMRMRVYDILKNIGTGQYKLKTYYVGQDRWGEKGAWWEEALYDDPEPDLDFQIVGLAITAGDVDGDGKDELVRTWPVEFSIEADVCGLSDYPVSDRFVRKLEVLNLPANEDKYSNTWDEKNDGIISGPDLEIFSAGERWWTNSYQDRLVIGDLNLDLKNEIIWLMSDQLRTYYHDSFADEVPPKVYKPFSDEKPLSSMKYPELVTGNFTWESIRVGRPSYRVQNRVDTPVAVINMPPKHRDLIRDVEDHYQLIESPQGECDPSPDSPNCTHAKYATLDYSSSEQTVSTTHAYEISAGLEAEACAGGGVGGIAEVKACVRTSVNATHGGNFENSTEEIESVTFKRKVIAANDDKVVYFGTPYGVWEYPILSDALAGTSDEAFITVAFALVSRTQYPDTSGGYYGGTCDETWFTAGHQPNNVWSYDPIGDITFPDYDPKFEPAYDAFEGDWAEGEISQLQANKDFESIQFNHAISARVATEVSAEAKLGVVNVSGNVKAHVQGDYSNAFLHTDTITNKEETTFSYFFAPQPDSAKFTTRVLFYRARDNSLVLNYQAEPGRSASWQLYDRPDPAFILPWYGFPDPEDPQVPPCGEEQKLFSPDIVINPPFASLGETVTISATVRNFSNEQTGNVLVKFYQGDPANNIVIDQYTIPSLSREAGPQTATTTWEAAGVGEQKIFAVIDPEDTIPEMHEQDDLINNNVAYGLVQLSAAGIADMGQAVEQPYDVMSYALGSPRPIVSLYMPRASLSAVARFEVGGAEIAAPTEELAGNTVFEVLAFQGSKYTMWDEPIKNFNLKPEANDPPAVITLAYTDGDIAGLNEANLTLYRFDGHKWEPAACAGYQILRFPEDNLIAVPVCKTGVFALSDKLPPVGENIIHLPLILKSAGSPAPDLVVKSINATVDNVLVVIKNVGSAPVNDAFWVDVYIDPVPAPTRVNQLWHDLADQGLVWGVFGPALPIDPVEELILIYQGDYYSASESSFSATLPLGTPLYAQVDSAHVSTDYGGVRESHELTGGPYNNITGPVLSTAGTLERVKSNAQNPIGGDLPPRR